MWEDYRKDSRGEWSVCERKSVWAVIHKKVLDEYVKLNKVKKKKEERKGG